MTKIDSLMFRCGQQRDPMLFSLTNDFLDNDANSEYGYKKFEGTIVIDGYTYDDEIIKGIGEIRFHAYNLSNLGFNYFEQKWTEANKHSHLSIAMDVDSSDTEFYYSVFKKVYTKTVSIIPFDEWDNMTFAITEGYLITLDRVYIKPEFRGQGIGQYIHENLFKIIYSEFNIVPLFAVGICVRDKGEPENMLEIQKKVLKNNGFSVFKHKASTAFCKYIYDNDFMVAVSR